MWKPCRGNFGLACSRHQTRTKSIAILALCPPNPLKSRDGWLRQARMRLAHSADSNARRLPSQHSATLIFCCEVTVNGRAGSERARQRQNRQNAADINEAASFARSLESACQLQIVAPRTRDLFVGLHDGALIGHEIPVHGSGARSQAPDIGRQLRRKPVKKRHMRSGGRHNSGTPVLSAQYGRRRARPCERWCRCRTVAP